MTFKLQIICEPRKHEEMQEKVAMLSGLANFLCEKQVEVRDIPEKQRNLFAVFALMILTSDARIEIIAPIDIETVYQDLNHPRAMEHGVN